METQLRLVIHRKKSIYDDLLVTALCVAQDKKQRSDEKFCSRDTRDITDKVVTFVPTHLNNRQIDSYAVSAYIHTLKRSNLYRRSAMEHLIRYSKRKITGGTFPVILMKLRAPQKQFLDYKWNEIMAQMALERSQVDHAMSWLSTLGGAFSALGDHFHHCAQMAGTISIRQFKLALKLGDPHLEARCKLYAALSIIQQGNLRIPKLMIQEIFKFAVDRRDTHLQRMCQGVWAKLKYCYKLKRQQKKKLKNLSIPEKTRKQ